MQNGLLGWFAREGLLLTDISVGAEDPEQDEVKVLIKAPLIALSRATQDFRESPDPVDYGYPEEFLDDMTLEDMHQFVYSWLERAVVRGMGHCFVCNKKLHREEEEKPWDAVFINDAMFCWLLVHFDCKRYLSRDMKGRHPFELAAQRPEFFIELSLDE